MTTHACPLCGFVHEIVVPVPPPTPPPVPAPTSTMVDAKLASGRVYDGVTFKTAKTGHATLLIDYSLRDVILRNCVIAPGGQNGISVNQSGSVRIANVTFENCHILAQPRMGSEITNRASVCYQGVNFSGCTFEPQGNEAVSYDSNPWGVAAGCAFTGNLVKGHGNVASQPYAAGIEINGPTGIEVGGNTFLRGRGPAFNLQMHTSGDCGWNIHDNVADMTAHNPAQLIAMNAGSQVVTALNVYGGKFAGNRIVSCAPGGSVAYFSGCHGMDWRGTTWADASRRAGYERPTQVNGCSGVLL